MEEDLIRQEVFMLDMLFALVAVLSMLIGLVLSVMLWVKSSKSVKELYKNACSYAIIDVVLGVLSYITYAATINSVDVDVREFYTNYFAAPLIVLAVLVVSIAAITIFKSKKIAM